MNFEKVVDKLEKEWSTTLRFPFFHLFFSLKWENSRDEFDKRFSAWYTS